MNRVLQHIRSNAVAYVALFVALGGTSYAALKLPANSVSGRQIRNHVIDPVKLNPKYITQSVRAWARVNSKGRITASSDNARILASVGVDQIIWQTPFFKNCVAIATVKNPGAPGSLSDPAFADASIVRESADRLGVLVSTYAAASAPSRQPYSVVVLCPVPPK